MPVASRLAKHALSFMRGPRVCEAVGACLAERQRQLRCCPTAATRIDFANSALDAGLMGPIHPLDVLQKRNQIIHEVSVIPLWWVIFDAAPTL